MYILQINKFDFNFPHPNSANEDGIVAWGGDMNPTRVLKAYQSGIFPWYAKDEPILWWSPSPRLIMELDDFKLSRSLKKSMKKFRYKFDTNFTKVIQMCADTRSSSQEGTWINSDTIEAFDVLHGMGIAHSVETYFNGELVGGLYGLSVGKVFCGESMFSLKSDASKSAYAVLIKHLKEWGYDFVDCQVPTEHLKSLGAKEVTREYFLERLNSVKDDYIDKIWSVDENITSKED